MGTRWLLCPGGTPVPPNWSEPFRARHDVTLVPALEDLASLDLQGRCVAVGAVPPGFRLKTTPDKLYALSCATWRLQGALAEEDFLVRRGPDEAKRLLTTALALTRREPVAPRLPVKKALSLLSRASFFAVGHGPWRSAFASLLHRGGLELKDWDGGPAQRLIVFDPLGLRPEAFVKALKPEGLLFYLAPLGPRDPGDLASALSGSRRVALWTYGAEPSLEPLRAHPSVLILPEHPRGVARTLRALSAAVDPGDAGSRLGSA